MKLSSATASDVNFIDYSVEPKDTDGALEQKETEYINHNWTQQYGYYCKIPELQASINALARWTMGQGYIAKDEQDEFLCNTFVGHGADSFNTILENLIRVAKIAGDSFAEIIRNDVGMPINVKPLNPGSIKIVANKKGKIIRYEQINKTKNAKFEPKDILHFSRDRTADEIHGISIIDAVEEIILMRNEAMSDMRQLMHRHVKPRLVYKLDTDNPAKIAEFKAKEDLANVGGENLYIPMGAVEFEVLSVASNAMLNPLPWIDRLNQYFFQAVSVPQIIVGGSQEMTEATAKVAFIAFEQTIKEEQLYIEEQVDRQLGISIKLEYPVSLQNEMMSSIKKGETMQASTPEDTSVKGVDLTGAQ